MLRRCAVTLLACLSVVFFGSSASWAQTADTPTATIGPSASPSASPAATSSTPSDLVCEDSACTFRLDGTQYLVLTMIGSTVVLLGVTQLVRSEAVPILRG